MKRAIVLLLLFSLCFAGEAWKVDTGAGVDTQPLVFGSRIITGTTDGKVYAVEPPFIKWSYSVDGALVCDPVSFGSSIIVATENKVYALDQYGGLQWETELPGIRAVAASDKIYVADDNGIQALNSDGTLSWNFMPGMEEDDNSPSTLSHPITAPLATPNYLVFGYGDYIYAVRTTGTFFWKKEIGHTWDAPPTLSANTLYLGTSEGILYGLDMLNGNVKSATNLFEQISTTPVVNLGQVIVGTSANHVYAISDNEVEWEAEVDGRVTHKMFLSTSPGSNVLYLTTTKSLYALDTYNGSILFKHAFLDWPSPPNMFNADVIVGTEEGRLYGIDSSKACSILYPEMDEQLSDAEITVKGLSYSAYGTPSTEIRIGEGEWIPVEGIRWSYDMDTSVYPYGVLDVECRVSDSTGIETEPYTKISVVHIEGTAEEIMTVFYPSSVRANTEFQIAVVDSSGAPISGVELTAGGQEFQGDGNITVSLPPGIQEVEVARPGYQTESFTIDSKDEPTLAYITGILFIIGLAAYVYFLFIRKEKKKKTIIEEKH
ncbi:PQQ-binding-like beta-propeller repeat protein [Candidatus Micrarchaeota archaeon]|nr:PQQ-binding-like beta-propeller repeat protein [Candidatus Micrarchaeota archaeon]MBD3417814.1 PQQ-binding-like beta-propeller repeat protein [Candidatus Micrarchaeota archaeon]